MEVEACRWAPSKPEAALAAVLLRVGRPRQAAIASRRTAAEACLWGPTKLAAAIAGLLREEDRPLQAASDLRRMEAAGAVCPGCYAAEAVPAAGVAAEAEVQAGQAAPLMAAAEPSVAMVLSAAAVEVRAAAEPLQEEAAEVRAVAAEPQRVAAGVRVLARQQEVAAEEEPGVAAAEVARQRAAPDEPVEQRRAARPEADAWAFRRALILPWPAPRSMARSARAMPRPSTALPSARSSQAARNED
jgi:hypothetical protein